MMLKAMYRESLFQVFITLTAFSLFIWGIITKFDVMIFLASLLLSILLGTIVLKPGNASRPAEAIFAVLIISSSLSVGFELQSNYPLGTDVHGEYYFLNLLKYGLIKPGELGHYSDILFFHYEFFIFELITGIHLIKAMKLVGTFIILLIPLATYVYVLEVLKKRESALIASIAIIIQSSYLITLHSTLKQVMSLFIAPILIFVLYKIVNNFNIRDITVYLILLLGLIGHYYGTSAIIVSLIIVSMLLHILVKGFSHGERRGTLYIITILTATMWFTWYTIFTSNILKGFVELGTRIVNVEPAEYYVYRSPLPPMLDWLRFIINAFFVYALILGTFSEKMLGKRNMKNVDVFELMLIATKILFITSLIAEYLKLSTIGLGRTFISYLVILSPIVYTGFRRILQIFNYILNLVVKNFLKLSGEIHIKLYVLILIIFILRFIITLGLFNFVIGDVYDIPFYDNAYGIRNGPSKADLLTLDFIEEHVFNVNITIATDFKSLSKLSYAPYLKLYARIAYNYFQPNVFDYYNERENYFIIYLSSHNIELGEIYASHKLYRKIHYYLPKLLEKNLVFNCGLTKILLHYH